MRRPSGWALAVAALCLAGTARAAPRLAVAPIQGDAKGAVGAQLDAALCLRRECIAAALSGGSVDLARARRAGAQGTLVGSIWKEKQGRFLSLALFTTGKQAARTWKLPLGRDGRLGPASLDRLSSDLDAVLGAPPPPAPPPTVAAAPPPPAPQPAPPPPPPVRSTEPAARPAPLVTAPVRLEPIRPAPRAGPLVALEIGLSPSHRELSYPGGGQAPVGVTVNLPAMPRLRLEVYPLATAGGAAGRAALFAEVGYNGGISVKESGRDHHATFSRIEVGALWRLPLSGLVLVPAIAYQSQSFVVGAVNGAKVAGLPDTRLSGLKGGLGLEVPLAGTRFTLLGGAGATAWLSAKDLAGGAGFFPGGSALGVAAEVGVAADLVGPLSVRLLGEWAMTRWSLDADPTGTYTNTSATEQAYGGRLMLRAAF